MKKTFFATMALLLLVPVMAFAQEEWGPQAKDWELTLQGTGNSDKKFDNNAQAGQAALGYYLTKGFELGLRQDISWAEQEGVGQTWSGGSRAFLDYDFNLERFRPFIGVSFGYLYGENTDDRWIAGPEAGLKYYAGRKTFLYALGEYNFTFKNSDEINDVYDDGRFSYSIGIGFNW